MERRTKLNKFVECAINYLLAFGSFCLMVFVPVVLGTVLYAVSSFINSGVLVFNVDVFCGLVIGSTMSVMFVFLFFRWLKMDFGRL